MMSSQSCFWMSASGCLYDTPYEEEGLSHLMRQQIYCETSL